MSVSVRDYGLRVAMNVHSRALSRAHWYGELISALLEAERLLLMLEASEGFPAAAGQLGHRIAAVRSEVETLNRIKLSDDRIIGAPWTAID